MAKPENSGSAMWPRRSVRRFYRKHLRLTWGILFEGDFDGMPFMERLRIAGGHLPGVTPRLWLAACRERHQSEREATERLRAFLLADLGL
jgi:hypothetical protein